MTNHLPLEIWDTIFSFCLPYNKFKPPSPSEAPLLTAQVCRRWRQISLSNGRHWSSLSLHEDLKRDHALPLLLLYAERAGPYPMSISVCRTFYDDPLIALFLNEIFKRCRHIRVYAGDHPFIWGNDYQDHCVPLLETFEFYHNSKQSLKNLGRIGKVLAQSSTKLTNLAWKDIESLPEDLSLLSWVQMRRLCLKADQIPSQVIGTLLTGSPNLVYLVIESWSSVIQGDTIYLPNLAFLAVSTAMDLGALLDSLILPSLRQFTLTSRSHQTWPSASFETFVSRSKCKLTAFNIYHIESTPESILRILEYFSDSLRELTLQNARLDPRNIDAPFINDYVVSLLTPTFFKEPPCLCPKLEVLALYSCIPCSDGAFFEMLNARTANERPTGVSQLRVFELFQEDFLRWGQDRWLTLRKNGLVIKTYDAESGRADPLDWESDNRMQQLLDRGMVYYDGNRTFEEEFANA
jgi:hypothetical protein